MEFRSTRSLALVALALALSSCGGGEGRNKLTCPASVIAPGLDTYTVFRPGGGTATEDIQFGVRLVGLRSSCHAEEKGVRVDSTITFQTARNDPQLRQAEFSYFVAIADAQQNILSKQIFRLQVNYDIRQNQMRIRDEISEHLPVKNLSSGSDYAIIVGLQLSKEQLERNRGATGTETAPGGAPPPPASGPGLLTPPPQVPR